MISGAAIPGRADQALRAVEEHLIRDQDGLVLLFTPPFENTPENPGYVPQISPALVRPPPIKSLGKIETSVLVTA